jgi:hypothetical protein
VSAAPRGRAVAGSFAVLFSLILLLLRPATPAAQVRDTTQARDTLAADTVPADTLPPPPLVPLRTPMPTGFAHGVWHWDQAALLRSRAVSLAHLLAGIPGVTVFRSGLFLQPEAASAFGATAGGLQIELDGYELDPLEAPALDLTRFELAQLEAVTVIRGVDGLLRLRIETLEPVDRRPYSRVEAATGEPNVNVFRGLLLAPKLFVGPIGVAIERVDTDGLGAAEPSDGFAGWLKWGWTRENRGVQLELRQMTMAREPASPWVSEYSRRDVVLRARNRFAPGLVGEVYAGRSRLELEGPEAVSDGVDGQDGQDGQDQEEAPPALERAAYQAGARVGLELPGGAVEGAVRFRDRTDLPRLAASIEAAFTPFAGRIAMRARFDREQWDGASATRFDVAASTAPLPWLRIFGELGSGAHAAPAYGRTDEGPILNDRTPILTDRTAYRAGAELIWRRLTAAAAFVAVETDSVAAFGLPFDSTFRRFAGGDVRGFEARGRIPLFVDWLAFEGSFTRWLQGTRWAYLPAASGVAALELNALPLDSDNLEILLRGEAVHRGEIAVPDTAEAAVANGSLTTIPQRTVFNADLIIRIMSVQAFLRYEDFSNQDPFDLPRRVLGGPRILYGVKWYFWN